MVTLLYSYFTNSLNITFFIILLLILEPFLKKYFSAVCLYRFWVVLLIGLLIPLRFEIKNSLFYVSLPQISTEEKADYEFEAPGISVFSNTLDKINLSQTKLAQNSEDTNRNDSQEIGNHYSKQILPAKRFSMTSELACRFIMYIAQSRYLFLYLLWITGAISLIGIKGIWYGRYLKQLKRFMSPINQEDLQEEFEQCIKKMYCNYSNYDTDRLFPYSKTPIFTCSIISSPMTIGIFKPTILLPDESYMKKDLHFILQHELVHIRRRDSLIKLIRFLVLSLNWYNPFCYMLSKHLDNWCEISCDELVLCKSTKSDCLDYSKLLLKCAAMRKSTTILVNLYGGKNNMKNRLFSILDQRKKYSSKLLVVLLLGIVSTTAIVSINNRKDLSASDQSDVSASDQSGISVSDQIDLSASAITSAPSETTDYDIIPENAAMLPSSNDSDLAVSKTTQKASDDTASQVASTTVSLGDTVAAYAIQAEDTPYIWGGNDLNSGVDCSGLVQAIYKEIGYDIPRTSREQLIECEEVSMDNLLPGDLIFYADSNNKVCHVGIYIGDDQIIHATNARDNVIVSDMNYRTPYCAGRVIVEG